MVAIHYWGEITIRRLEDERGQSRSTPYWIVGSDPLSRPALFAMAFSPDGKRLATAGSDAAVGGRHGLPGGTVISWDVDSGKLIHKSERFSTAASSVVWSEDGNRIAAGTNGADGELAVAGQVAVWDFATGKSTISTYSRT